MMKKVFIVLALFAIILKVNGQGMPFCPNITALSSTVPLCGGSCTTLSANVVAVNQTNTYSIQSIPYVPYSFTGGTAVSVGVDDVWSQVINLGFDFCYFGNTYQTCILGSNGQLSFSVTPPLPGGFNNWVISTAIPNTVDLPGNTICAAFRDIDPSFGGNMRYYFTGTAPCRALVIYWSNIPMFSNPGSCSGIPNSTFQLVLYENTNFIDVYIQNSTTCPGWNGGRGIIGIQNMNGTVAYSPPNRNFPNTWTAINEAWRFVPTGPQSYTVSWAGPSGPIGTGITQTVCPSSTTTYTATMNVTSCTGVNSTYTSAVTVTVSPNPPPVVTANVPSQLSCTSATNAANAVITSGTPGYTVNWAPPATMTGSTATTYSVSGMSAGVNTVTVKDANGCTGTTTLSVNPLPAVPSFSISAPSGTVLGCSPSTLNLIAVNTSTLANMSYTWTSASTGTFVGNPWVGGAPLGTNILTVTAMDATAGSCAVTQTIAISQVLTPVPVTVTPISRTLTCNGACASFTALTTTTTNITGQWFAPGNVPIGSSSSTPLLGCFNSPGTYTVVFIDGVTGCTGTQTVSVFANNTVPTISVTANLGYSITCSVPCVSLAISASSNIAPVSYSWTNVTSSVVSTPSNGGYSVCVPGNYIASFKDGNNCTVSQTVTVFIDTLRIIPTATTNLPSNSFTLNCKYDTLLATAISNPMLSANNYSWTVPPNLTTFTNQVSVNLSNITSTTSPTNYTVLCTNPVNGCVGRSRVSFYKDVFVPKYNAVFTPSAITCSNLCIQFSPQLASGTSTIPITFTFTSPAPTTTNNIPGSTFCSAGTYTMNYTNSQNGCSSVTTAIVPLNTVPPSTVPLSPVQIPCGQTTTVVTAGTTTTSTTYTYVWKGPMNSGFSCSNCYSTTVNMPGVYFVTITNTVNGCATTNSILVTTGSLDVSMTANPSSGFSPLGVSFENTTPFTSSSGTMTTIWNYGTGSSVSTTSLANTYTGSATPYPDGAANYLSAGTYTVLLTMTQQVGTVTCVGTATALVTVDLPSALTVPNVFTPNGDGVNDTFFLQTTGLSSITFTVFDRWGVKMYDVKSESGNVSWDGKNLFGKEVPAGTYFYLLKATGRDQKEYEQKGSMSLFR